MLYGYPMFATTTTYEAATDFELELAADVQDDMDALRAGDVDALELLLELEALR